MMGRKKIITCISLVVALLYMGSMTGCGTMKPLGNSERYALYQIGSCGIDINETRLYSPKAAAFLSLLPGGGYYYLAGGSGQTELWLPAIFNTITWPVSWLLGISGSYSDAELINKRSIIKYYQYHPQGQKIIKENRKKYRTDDLGIPSLLEN